MVEPKTLITYASKSNATAENAAIIANVLKKHGHTVELVNLRETNKPDVGPYDNIIVGSGIRVGMWYRHAKKMLKRKDIINKQLFVFISCGTACEPDKREEAINKYITPMMNKLDLNPIAVNAFAGTFPGNEEDKRDPNKVREWVAGILDKMK